MAVATTKNATAEPKDKGGISPSVRKTRNHHPVKAIALPKANEMRCRERAHETVMI